MKKQYRVEVDCANCAAKMEEAARKVKDVEELTISFMTQKMQIRFAEGADMDAVVADVVKVCRRVEPDFEMYL